MYVCKNKKKGTIPLSDLVDLGTGSKTFLVPYTMFYVHTILGNHQYELLR